MAAATFSPEISARARRLERGSGEVLDPLGRVRRELAAAAAELREAELAQNTEETFRPRINSRSEWLDPGRTTRDPLPRHERLYVEAMQRQRRREAYVETVRGASPGSAESGGSAAAMRRRPSSASPASTSASAAALGGSADGGLDFYERVVESQRKKDAELALLRELRDASLEVDGETGQPLYRPATGASRHAFSGKREEREVRRRESEAKEAEEQARARRSTAQASKESQLLVRRRMVRSLRAMHAALVARQTAMGAEVGAAAVTAEGEAGTEGEGEGEDEDEEGQGGAAALVDFGNEAVLRAELTADEYAEVTKAVGAAAPRAGRKDGDAEGPSLVLSSKAFVARVRAWLERPESGTMSSRGHVLLGRGHLVARSDGAAAVDETYSPRISEVSSNIVRKKGEGFYERQANAAAREQAWLEEQRRQRERAELEGCTFKPEINERSEVLARKHQGAGGSVAGAPTTTDAVYTQVAALIDERAEETGVDPTATPAPGTVAEIEHLIRAQVASRAAQPPAV